MPRKQLLLLFLINLVPFTIAGGMIPLLPIYALELEASSIRGNYRILCFYCILSGRSGYNSYGVAYR